MPSFTPTDEQLAIIDSLGSAGNVAVEAFAGTGKTSTLVAAAKAHPRKRMRYMAFNASIVADAKSRFPDNVAVATSHSVAMGAVGRDFRHRLGGSRTARSALVAAMRINDEFFDLPDGKRKRLAAQFLAGVVEQMVRNFERSGDQQPEWFHCPLVQGLDPGVNGRGPNGKLLAHSMVKYARLMWDDLQQRDGWAKFDHSSYLKIWSLGRPQLDVDTVLLDEAQDTSGALLYVINNQDSAQVVLVGDPYQAIYGWAGAIDSISKADVETRLHLTESWRFGSGVAGLANEVLAELGAELPLVGNGPPTRLGRLSQNDAELWRTNGGAIGSVARHLKADRKPALVGGGKDIIAFAKGAAELKARNWTGYFELAPFTSWGEVQDFTDSDVQGGELKTLVKLVDEHSPEGLIQMIGSLPDEARADVVISTAHKAKGREWDSVRLGSDFPDPELRELSPEELRLIYVSVTRAKVHIDHADVRFFGGPAAVNEAIGAAASPGAAYLDRKSEEDT